MVIEFNKIYSKDIRDLTWNQVKDIHPKWPDLSDKYGLVFSAGSRAVFLMSVGVFVYDRIKASIWEDVIERLRKI